MTITNDGHGTGGGWGRGRTGRELWKEDWGGDQGGGELEQGEKHWDRLKRKEGKGLRKMQNQIAISQTNNCYNMDKKLKIIECMD